VHGTSWFSSQGNAVHRGESMEETAEKPIPQPHTRNMKFRLAQVKTLSLEERINSAESLINATDYEELRFKYENLFKNTDVSSIEGREYCESELHLDLDAVGVPLLVASSAPAGWRPFSRQKPGIMFVPAEPGVVCVNGIYGKMFDDLENEDMTPDAHNYFEEVWNRLSYAQQLQASGHHNEALMAFERIVSGTENDKTMAGTDLKLSTLKGLAESLYMIGDREASVNFAQQVLEVSLKSGRREEGIAALKELAYVQFLEGDMDAAVDSLEQALALVHSVQAGLIPYHHSEPDGSTYRIPGVDEALDSLRIDCYEDHSEIFNFMQYLLMECGRIEQALVVCEQSKAQAMSIMHRNTHVKQITSWENLKHMVIQQACSVLEYAVLQIPGTEIYELVIWVVSHDGELLGHARVALESCGGSLRGLLEAACDSIGVRGCKARCFTSQGDIEPQKCNEPDDILLGSEREEALYLSKMYELCIKPVTEHLARCDELLIIPDRELHLFPWPALLDDKGGHLIQYHPLRNAPSLSVACFFNKPIAATAASSERHALVVGNPWPLAKYLKQLPFAEIESEGVSSQLGQAGFTRIDLLTKIKADKSAVLRAMDNASWIHIASHCIVDEQSLALASDKSDDGILKMEEIIGGYNKGSGVSLAEGCQVILSACNTAHGQINAEGVIGLARTFMLKGASCVMASLWSINDASTQQLMQSFYAYMLSGMKMPQALRAAMLQMMGKQPLMYDVQVGDTDRVHEYRSWFNAQGKQERLGLAELFQNGSDFLLKGKVISVSNGLDDRGFMEDWACQTLFGAPSYVKLWGMNGHIASMGMQGVFQISRVRNALVYFRRAAKFREEEVQKHEAKTVSKVSHRDLKLQASHKYILKQLSETIALLQAQVTQAENTMSEAKAGRRIGTADAGQNVSSLYARPLHWAPFIIIGQSLQTITIKHQTGDNCLEARQVDDVNAKPAATRAQVDALEAKLTAALRTQRIMSVACICLAGLAFFSIVLRKKS
jgi:CHAT domain-containing protein/tetratricopeptide (TPR) repeat protein